MTENEAIEVLKDFDKQAAGKADGAYQTAIGEIACKLAISALEEIQQYRALGTIEELRSAMEKQVPKRPSEVKEDYFVCPQCGSLIKALDDLSTHKHCLNCGQAIDWSEEND